MKRYLTGLIAGCSLLFAPSALLAVAGEGIQLGPVLLYPALAVSETYDDNIAMTTEETQQSDWITKVSPALRIALPVQRYFIEAEGGLDIVRYQEFDSENSADWFAGAAAGGEFPGGLSFKIGDTHRDRYLVSSQEYGPGERSSLNKLQAMVSYAIRDVLRLELGGMRKTYTYDLSIARERVESNVQADLFWKFEPSLSALVEVGFTDFGYDSNTRQDGSATHLALGLTWEFTRKSTGVAKAGYLAKRYKNEDESLGIEAADTWMLSAAVAHQVNRRMKVDIDLTRATEESDFSENPYFVRYSLGVLVGQYFTSKVYGRAGLRYGRDDYPHNSSYVNPYDAAAVAEEGKRSDTSWSGSLALGFNVSRWLALELAYGGVKRDSNFDTFDFTSNQVSLSAKAAF